MKNLRLTLLHLAAAPETPARAPASAPTPCGHVSAVTTCRRSPRSGNARHPPPTTKVCSFWLPQMGNFTVATNSWSRRWRAVIPIARRSSTATASPSAAGARRGVPPVRRPACRPAASTIPPHRRPQPASPRRQAPRNVASILEAARELGIRDVQAYADGDLSDSSWAEEE